MTKKLQHLFALSEKGAEDLVKAVAWCFVCNLSLMLPVGAVLFTVQHLLDSMENGGSSMDGFWIYAGFGIAVLILLFILHWFQYASLYLATYKESANRRVSLAETLRQLPLSFFGNRDLSDLTSTMIADCSSLDQMFSHYVPQLFASIFSTLVIGAAMFLCDWRMALAVLWVVPVALLLTAGSKKIQDSFGTRNILNKRAVADCIQEGLETIRDIKACSRQEAYMEKLEKKLPLWRRAPSTQSWQPACCLLRPGLPSSGSGHYYFDRRSAFCSRRTFFSLFPRIPFCRRKTL